VSFLDRLRECRYISPSGKEYTPLFDDVERSGGKKAAVHELPFRDVADVQDLGNQAEKYPMALYFTGPDYDQLADAFYAALREKGRGKLKHPRWGDIDVLPITRSQTEKLIDKVWYCAFQVDFIEAPDPASLTISTTTAAAIQAAADNAAAVAAAALSLQQSALKSQVELVKMKGKAVSVAASAVETLKSGTSGFDDVRSALVKAQKDITRNIDALTTDPMTLTDSLIQLIRTPADMVTAVTLKLGGFGKLILDNIVTLEGLTIGAALAIVPVLLGATVAAAQSTASGTLASRADAIDAYNALTDSAASALAAVEGYVDDPAALGAVRQLASDARARLLVESYSLPTERSMVLQGDSNPILLAQQLYGDPERFNDICDQNGLDDDFGFIVPRGTEIRWYE
jgi:prophage DNA circulation protein